jgi:hypothetical protein
MRREERYEVVELSAVVVSCRYSWLSMPCDCCTALLEASRSSTRSRRCDWEISAGMLRVLTLEPGIDAKRF